MASTKTVVKRLFVEELEKRVAPAALPAIENAADIAFVYASPNSALNGTVTTLALGEEDGGLTITI